MSNITNKKTVSIIDGNQLAAKVIDSTDDFVQFCVDRMKHLPDSPNADRVQAIKEQMANGTYNLDAHLDDVADALLSDPSLLL